MKPNTRANRLPNAERQKLKSKRPFARGRTSLRNGRKLCRCNFAFGTTWQGTYAVKQVAPVIMEEGRAIMVITVYTFYSRGVV